MLQMLSALMCRVHFDEIRCLKINNTYFMLYFKLKETILNFQFVPVAYG